MVEKTRSELVIVGSGATDQVESAKQLFLEYANSLNFSLCFQNFDKELAGLPGEYSPPSGRLVLAFEDGKLAGCVALRKIDNDICEMKRLYMRPAFRARGIGRRLATKIVEEAQEIGYLTMRLDTTPSMKEAISLYRSLGFEEIESYRYNPLPGTLFMELKLDNTKKQK